MGFVYVKRYLNGRMGDINGLIINVFYIMLYLMEIYFLYMKIVKFFMKEKLRYI